MDPVALLTILGLVVAVYAIIPPERKLDFRLRLNWLDWTIIIVSIVSIHYILFHPVLSELGIAFDIGDWRWGFDPSNTSYLIILFASIVVFIRTQRAPLRSGKIELFRQLTERLLQEGKYSDLLFFLQHHHKRLFQIYNADLFLPRLRKKIKPPKTIITILLEEEELHEPRSTIVTRIKNSFLSIGSVIALVLPTGEKGVKIAEDVVRRVFLTEDFVMHMAKTRPYFALDLLTNEFYERKAFLELYVRKLLDCKSSVLYFEIQNNQNLDSSHRYFIDKRNRFITFFLKDVTVAEKLGIWKPFGDYAINHLDILARDSDNDNYNGPLGNYDGDNKWSCPVHTSIQFFKIMIPEALFQGVQWHMWLYYLPHITSKIIRNLSPKPNVDLDREWPTPYHCLLYEIVAALDDWISAVENVSINQSNIVLKNERIDHENGNIPKSAILAMGQVFYDVIETDSLDIKFKSYLLGIALRTMHKLTIVDKTRPFGNLLKRSIIKGGNQFGSNRKSFQIKLNDALQNIDIVTRFGFNEFEQDLKIELSK